MKYPQTIGGLLCLLCLLVLQAAGQTISPDRLLGRYQQFVWQDQHGLPQNGISAVVQSADSYLWLATAEGVVRFDGVRFTAFDTGNTPELKSNNIASVYADRAGALWAAYGSGLTRYQQGRFTFFSTEQGLTDARANALFEDRAGNLWIGTQGGLAIFRQGRFTTYTTRDGLPDNRVTAFAEDGEGGLWIGTMGGLARFSDGRFTVYTTRDGLAADRIQTLCRDRAGTLWIGTDGGGVSRFIAGRFSQAGLPPGLRRNRVQAMAEDRAGSVWIGSIGAGLFRFSDGRFDAITTREGLASDFIQAICPAPNGDVWLGTQGSGLALLRDARFSVYTTRDGLPHDIITTLHGDGDGALWVNSLGGLSRFQDGRFTVMTARDGLPLQVRALAVDHAGNLLASAGAQVLRYKAGRFSPYVTKAGLSLSSILMDRAGNLWAGTQFDGLQRFRDGQATACTVRDGLADNYITALFEDRAGRLWVGTGNGLSCLSDGRFTSWTQQDGFPGKHLLSFYEDRAGQLWIGTDGNGLIRCKDGRFTAITVKDGLYDNLAFQILEDDQGNLWMSGNKGIYRAALKELNEFADGQRRTVASFAYGANDGMLSRECNGASPAGWKTADGRLWFPTIKGLVAVNPQPRSAEPPRLAIEQVSVDGAARPVGQTLRLRPGEENLEIQYTALSWERPHAIRFRYQLAGFDQEWTEAGTRRAAYFPHLPPGSYSFRVIADNGEGVWNETGASFSFVVIPPFYRAWWFLALSLAGVAGLAFGGYKWRVRQLERANAAQRGFSRRLINAHEGERQRIAAELHDGLSQSLVIIRHRATICLNATDDPERRQEQLQEIAEASTAVIDEVREIIYDLRPVQLDRLGLTKSIEEMLDKVAGAHGLTIRRRLDDIDGLLPKDAENNIYRIIQESINNVVRHAQAGEAGVEIRKNADDICLVVEDDGRGFIPDETRDWSAGSGFGLPGIVERVRMLGGVPLIESAPNLGTTVTIRIPLRENQQ